MNDSFETLLEKYLTNSITKEEEQRLLELSRRPEYRQAMAQRIDEDLSTSAYINDSADHEMHETIYAQLQQQLHQTAIGQAPRRVRLLPRFVLAAASILLLISVAWYWWFTPAATPPVQQVTKKNEPDVAPGKKGAILTLADGSQVVLDSLTGRKIPSQNGTELHLHEGHLQYDATNARAVSYNTMRTPRGRQFEIVLPDGSKAWLNAASSITYPTVFEGNERKVEMTGEVYFEVAKKAQMPFRVSVNKAATVEVLGTHFNINAYNDEPAMHATLLEGSVKVTGNAKGVVIKPGQQAAIGHNGALDIYSNVNTEQIMAWKNGFFNFNDKKLDEVMRQIARWYDLKVVYEKDVPNIGFYGKVSRNVKLSNMLKLLEAAEVRFRIEEGNRLIVMP